MFTKPRCSPNQDVHQTKMFTKPRCSLNQNVHYMEYSLYQESTVVRGSVKGHKMALKGEPVIEAVGTRNKAKVGKH